MIALDVMFWGALYPASGAAPDAGATQWALIITSIGWHGECPPLVTIYLCQVRRRWPIRRSAGRTWPEGFA